MAEPAPSERSLETVALLAPVTAERKLNTHLNEQMPKPYLARALAAVDPKYINGSPDHQDNNMTVLQQHVAFFDKNKDGIIYPIDTYKGFHVIGFNVFLAIFATIVIHVAFGFATQPGWIPSLLLPIYVSHIHKAKHGSDSETYDTEGRFDPAKFDAIFSKYARKHPDMLSFCEMQCMLKGNRNLNDFFGWLAAELEWVFIYILIRNKKGYIEKEQVRAMFDGSLFEVLEKKNTKSKTG
ncbi:peroxygenase [Cryptomeria japonica]|uniref:peroxygenase n=1 Tax=Cryptomeria japonica TaxID=3369 RepID=UPI0025AD434A|nr:peroxygenase [Cryptomeria japonica]